MFVVYKLCDLPLSFTDFLNKKKHPEPYTVQNAKILNPSNYQNVTKKAKSEVCAFVVMLLIVIQELLQYCETLKAS